MLILLHTEPSDWFVLLSAVLYSSNLLSYLCTLLLKLLDKSECCKIPVRNEKLWNVEFNFQEERITEMTANMVPKSKLRKIFNVPEDFL